MAQEQAKWLHLNARKRNNIPGLLPLCIGMCVRINNGAGSYYKDYGLHTGTLGVITKFQLSESDAKKVQNNDAPEMTL